MTVDMGIVAGSNGQVTARWTRDRDPETLRKERPLPAAESTTRYRRKLDAPRLAEEILALRGLLHDLLSVENAKLSPTALRARIRAVLQASVNSIPGDALRRAWAPPEDEDEPRHVAPREIRQVSLFEPTVET